MIREVSAPRPLGSLPTGTRGTLRLGRAEPDVIRYLEALGLLDGAAIRICRQGKPCIVEVGSTRVGIATDLALCLAVAPEANGSRVAPATGIPAPAVPAPGP